MTSGNPVRRAHDFVNAGNAFAEAVPLCRAEPERAQPSRAVAQGGADPVMLRAYCGGHKGATAFFRNRPLLDASVAFLREKRATRVLFHACSVGAEPYSLALWWLRHGATDFPLQIFATDIEPAFIAVAKQAEYPAAVLNGMTESEQRWFEHRGETVAVPAAARQAVTFLPPMSFVDGSPGHEFDATFVMNALTYVTPTQQRQALHRIGGYTRWLMGLTAFHPDTIADDVRAAGFAPLSCDCGRIHGAWGDRLTRAPILPGTPEYSWRLPPYDAPVPEREFRFSSLFARAQG